MTNEDVMYELLSKFRVFYSSFITGEHGYLDFKYRTHEWAKKFDYNEVAWNNWTVCGYGLYPHPVHAWMLVAGICPRAFGGYRMGYADILLAIVRVHDAENHSQYDDIVDFVICGGKHFAKQLEFYKNGAWDVLFKYPDPDKEQKQCINLHHGLQPPFEPIETCCPPP